MYDVRFCHRFAQVEPFIKSTLKPFFSSDGLHKLSLIESVHWTIEPLFKLMYQE